MAAATIAATVAVGATVAASQVQKKSTEKAGNAYKKVGRGIARVDNVEKGVRQLLGGDQEAGSKGDRYQFFQDKSYEVLRDQIEGNLSGPTRQTLARRALDTGAVGLGPGAIDDVFSGYLGLTQEEVVNQGFQNYRAMFGQLATVAQNQQMQNYQMQMNAAGIKANSIMQQGQATASMIQGIGSIVGGFAGGLGGGGGAGGMFGAGFTSSGGAQPSGAYFANMAQAGRSPYPAGMNYLGGI